MATKENKVNKISINILKEIIKAEKLTDTIIDYKFGDNQVNITVKNGIDKDNKVRFVRDILNGCFVDDEYVPYYREELFKIAILEYFTNIKIDTVSDILFDLVNKTELYNTVIEIIPNNIVNDLRVTVENLIDWRKQEILSTYKEKTELMLLDMETTLNQIEHLIELFNSISKDFDGIDQKEAFEIYKKIANKDEYQIAEAVINITSPMVKEDESIDTNILL